jgi:hypothetical protein
MKINRMKIVRKEGCKSCGGRGGLGGKVTYYWVKSDETGRWIILGACNRCGMCCGKNQHS